MNLKIPNGSYCLFSQDEGGSRNGKIVLVELYNKQDWDLGSRYTIKEYNSKKVPHENHWRHTSISLKPLSDNSDFKTIELTSDETDSFRVVGIFERVLV